MNWKTKLVKRGDEFLIVFNKKIEKLMNLNENSTVELIVKDDGLIIKPIKDEKKAKLEHK